MNRFAAAWNALRGAKSAATRREWVASTVRTGERAGFSHFGDSEAQRLLSIITGVAYTAHLKRARIIAGHPIGVYRKVDSFNDLRGKAFTRTLTPRERKKLVSQELIGTKAANLLDSEGDVEQVFNHPACWLLETPNPECSGFRLRQAYHMMLSVTGNAYWLMSFENTPADILDQRYSPSEGQPSGLYALFPQNVSPIADPDGFRLPAAWRYARNRADPVVIDADRVIHSVYLDSPANPFRGEGAMWSSERALRTITSRQEANLALADQNNRPDFMIDVPGLSEAERKSVREAIEAQFANPHTAGAFLVVGSDDPNAKTTLTPLGFPVKPEAMTELDQHLIQEILASAELPEDLYKSDGGGIGADGTHPAMTQFARLTMRPALRGELDDLNTHLAPMFDDEIVFACEDPVPEDRTSRITELTTLSDKGHITTNQVLEALGYEKSDDEFADRHLYMGQPLGQSQGLGSLFGPTPIGLPSKPDAPEVVAEPVGPKIEEQALNGAQIKELVSIATQVSQGALTRAAGRAIAAAAFPGVPADKIDEIFNNIIEGGSPPDGDGNEESVPNRSGPQTGSGDTRGGDRSARGGVEALGKRLPLGDDDGEGAGLGQGEGDDAGVGGGVSQSGDGEAAGEGSGKAGQPVEVKLYIPGQDPWEHCGCIHTKDDDLRNVSNVLSDEEEKLLAPFAREIREAYDDELAGVLETGSTDGLREALERVMDRSLPEIFRLGAQLGLNELDAGDISLMEPDRFATAYVQQNGPLIAETAADSAGQAIGRALQQFADAGLDDDEARAEVQRRLGEVSQARAEAIARTETQRAVQGGRMDAWAEAGVAGKYWLRAGGACPICEAIAAEYGDASKAIPVGDAFYEVGDTIQRTDGKVFTVGFKAIRGGDAHVNCRCTLVPVEGE